MAKIEPIQGKWLYIEKLKAENKQLRQLLKRNKTGDCWCDLDGSHSKLCIEIQKILETE